MKDQPLQLLWFIIFGNDERIMILLSKKSTCGQALSLAYDLVIAIMGRERIHSMDTQNQQHTVDENGS